MGSIVSQIRLTNQFGGGEHIEFSALVDTGSTYLVLPMAWKSRLGEIEHIRTGLANLADGRTIETDIWGPLKVEIDNFPATYTEVVFMDMGNKEESYEALLGHLPLQQANLGLDMLNHKLFSLKYIRV